MPEQSQLLLNFPTRPEFDFSNFVVSDGSRFAFDAARNFCSLSKVPYQSLFLFGHKNLGKTHLLLSIGNLASEKGNRALYIKGADFCHKIGDGKSSQSQQTLKKLMGVDYFLLDDVEALGLSVAAQEKLYHIYNTVIEKGGKVAFASYFSPDKIKNAENYLTSRFQWGMIAEIKPIDDTTTAKIIHKLAKDIDLILAENIIDFLLSRIPRDFISLQNAVTVLNRESYVQKKKVTLALVKKALKIP
jgi:chromosomal replication initiator protein